MSNESFTMAGYDFIRKYQCLDDIVFFKIPEFDAFNYVQGKFYYNLLGFYLDFEDNIGLFDYSRDNLKRIHKDDDSTLGYICQEPHTNPIRMLS